MIKHCATILILVAAVDCGSVAQAALIHHYRFDANPNDSVGTLHGTLAGASGTATIVSTAIIGGGSVFLNNSPSPTTSLQWVTLPGPAVPTGATNTTTFSIAGWGKFPTQVSADYFGSFYGEFVSTTNAVRNFLGAVPTPTFSQFTPSGGDLNSGVNIDDDAWHHVAYVQNPSLTPRRLIYVDGVLASSDSALELYNAGAPNVYGIGGRGGTAPRFLDGNIDDLGFWDESITGARVAAIHGLGKFSAVSLSDPLIDDLLNLTLGETLLDASGEFNWLYTNGLTGLQGITGGSILGGDAFIVLTASGEGVVFAELPLVPEPSMLVQSLLGLAGLMLTVRKRRKP